ncbi:MAG: ATP-binding protein [Desulfobacteraceae bacterium]|jgi:PAS domain S-box-containing protein
MKVLFGRLRFETKLNLGIIAIVIGMAVILLPVVSSMTSRVLIEENRLRGVALAESLAARAVNPLLAQDYLALRNMVAVGGDVVYAFIQNAENRVVTHSFLKGFPVDLTGVNTVSGGERVHIQLVDTGENLIYDFAAPITVSGERIGTVRIGLSKSRISDVIRRFMVAMTAIFAVVLLAAMAMGSLFARTVTRRLSHLRVYAEGLVCGGPDQLDVLPNEHFCWEIMDCMDESCPAHHDKVRRCWLVPDTRCSGHACGMGLKPSGCKDCPVFMQSVGDEIQDLAEALDYMAFTLRDYIRDLRAAEQNLTTQQRLLSTVLDMNPDLISMVDSRMLYQTANRAFAESVGRNEQDILGCNDFHLFPEEEAERRNLQGRQVLATGARVDRQERVDGPEGTKWFQVVQIPVPDESGRTVGLLRMDRDITDIKEYEQQLIQAQKMESVGKLAGGVAHEINTPLSIILGYAQLLKSDAPPDSQMAADLAIIEKQTKVCRQIVADLLGFSRQGASSKREMCFNNSVMEVVSLVRHSFSMDRVEIVTRLDDRFPIIYGDPEKLKQVWINLMNNARDVMADTGGVIVVRTELNTPKGIVTLQIADTGSGIDAASMKKIFDPFYTTKAVGKGTGLGLSVSFGIIKDHMGEIRVDSPLPESFERPQMPDGAMPGPGTIFTVDIPLDHCSTE